MISNRCDQLVLSIFFSCIKQNAGSFTPNVFMTDMAEAFFNAWVNVMGMPKKRLFCAWHVDNAWRKNLNKINGSVKRIAAYKILRGLLTERDVETFKLLIQASLNYFKNDIDTLEFAKYFETYYLKNTSTWAYCYRLHSGLNTDMHLERMHRTLKYIYLHGKHVKRLDKAIHSIMRFIRDKMVDRLIKLSKGKVTSKVKDLRNRHKTSLDLNLTIIENEGKWLINSTKNDEIYVIEKIQNHSCCKLACSLCDVCIHQYICTCMDSSIKWNMCKHIHYLCRQNVSTNSNVSIIEPSITTEINDSLSEDRLIINIDTETESEVILRELNQGCSSKTLTPEENRLLLINKYTEIVNSLVKTPEQFKFMEQNLKSLAPQFNAISDVDPSKSFPEPSNKNLPGNKNIVPQRVFHVKKNQKKSKIFREENKTETLSLIIDHKNKVYKN